MSGKNGGKALTMDLVFTKTKSDNLQNIKNLNLWGNDLEDLRLIDKMPNLEVVSLSVNRIHSLKEFAKCAKLQELYLRKNNISDLRQIKHLMKLPTLKVLWLHDNPCSQVDNYREIVIKHLPHLIKLDNNPVTNQQRQACQLTNFSFTGSDDYETTQQQEQPQPLSEAKWGGKQMVTKIYEEKPVINAPSSRGSNDGQKFSKNKVAPRARQLNGPTQQMTRNQNIVMAVLSLMKELDPGSLQIIKREAQNMIRQ